MKTDRLQLLRDNHELPFSQLLLLIIQLSVPAILAQVSTTIMEYIDASMVGHLGSAEAAGIGLVSSSTWLMGGLCSAVSIGFTVQIAHRIGAKEEKEARDVVKQGLLTALGVSVLLLAIGVGIHNGLPVWLGAESELHVHASRYFFIFSLAMPAAQMNNISAGMLQCSGNMKIPSILQIVMCVMDVVFNTFLIFPTRMVALGGLEFQMPGLGLGVMGAALGTALAEAVTACLMLYFLLFRSEALRLRKGEGLQFSGDVARRALKIGIPIGIENVVMCSAYIMNTRIVSPLGMNSIAANSFAITTEGVCYMPGYGIGVAATTLIGQSLGAKRYDVARKLSWIITLSGMIVMTGMGFVMFRFAPWMIGLITPDPVIRDLGASVLRIEAFAEPMYAASIVASGVFRGAGDTFMPSMMVFVSMWLVRLPLMAWLSGSMGLKGVWIAMLIELCFRGTIFLVRLGGKSWMKKMKKE